MREVTNILEKRCMQCVKYPLSIFKQNCLTLGFQSEAVLFYSLNHYETYRGTAAANALVTPLGPTAKSPR